MCGIFCYLCPNNDCELLTKYRQFESNLKCRGPDLQDVSTYNLSGDYLNYNCIFAGNVLWLQNQFPTKQPVDSDKFILLFNGDIYDVNNDVANEKLFKNGDVTFLADTFESLPETEIVKFLSTIHGPYSIIYFNKESKKLYFGRDNFGRKSLLFATKNKQIIITSCAIKNSGFDFIEIPAIGIFSIDFKSDNLNINYHQSNWNMDQGFMEMKLMEFGQFVGFEMCFDLAPNLNVRLPISADIDYKMMDTKDFEILLSNRSWLRNVELLQSRLEQSVKNRTNYQPQKCQNCIKDFEHCNHSVIALLFSGGLDCTVLAVLLDKFVPQNQSIDLLNVAFERKLNDDYLTPDRLTGLQSLLELQTLCPNRIWNFLEINVTKKELQLALSDWIANLIYPLKTVIDESLGCALWFASRAIDKNSYQSPCRIIISGIGADELLGGYSRHRKAFSGNNWQCLTDELNYTWIHISERNLGRDDRVICHHGRQLRTPYIDENVVQFLRSLSTWEKCYPKCNNNGYGDKLLLRLLAYRLKLRKAAYLPKRAMQFGSRIANKNQKGHEISPWLID